MLKQRFDWSGPCLVAVLAAAAFVGCRDATGPIGPHGMAPAAAAYDLASAPTLETFYGPERFTRGKGAPETFTRQISTARYEAPFVLHVRSGDASGANRVSSATVRLDGTTMLAPSAFNQQQGEWSFPVTLGSTAVLSVSLASAPGSYLDIWIEGKRSGTLFCSDGSSDASDALRKAIAATPAGGTVLVCAGRHLVSNVLIDKPLTVTSESGTVATLDGGSGPGGQVLFVGNVTPAGTVNISGLRFTGGAFSNVFLGNNAGNVNVSANEFNPPQTAPYGGTVGWLSGLQLGGTGIGAVLVAGNTFIGGDVGFHINSPSGSPTLRGNTFLNQNNSSIHIAGPRPGPIVIEGNTFRGCGTNWCLFTQHGVTVVGNTIEILTGRSTYAPLRIDNFSGGTSVVSDNVITGLFSGADRGLDANYSIRGRAIQVYGDGRIDRNRITYAYNGIGASNATLTGGDNVIEHTYAPFASGGSPSSSTIAMTRNDLLDYVVTLDASWAFSAVNLTCNYWGSASGPTGITGSSSWYTPFSKQPIANQLGVVCP